MKYPLVDHWLLGTSHNQYIYSLPLICVSKFSLAVSFLACGPKISHSLMEYCLAHKSVTLLSPSMGTVNHLLFEELQSELEKSMSLTSKEVNDFLHILICC